VSTTPSAERQNSLDAHIQARIQAELKQLRAEEQDVRDQIQAALEKENLDRERAMAGDPDAIKSSASLMADLDDVRAKVDRFHARKDLSQFPAVQADAAALVACYRSPFIFASLHTPSFLSGPTQQHRWTAGSRSTDSRRLWRK
jgi:altered-inheritance-of-mitochondria protein 13